MTDNCDMCRKNDWPCHLHGLMEGGAANHYMDRHTGMNLERKQPIATV